MPCYESIVMSVSLAEAKLYLRIDTDDEDSLIISLIKTAQRLCEDILRQRIRGRANKVVKTAVLYATCYLYENRESANMGELITMLSRLLFGDRKEAF